MLSRPKTNCQVCFASVSEIYPVKSYHVGRLHWLKFWNPMTDFLIKNEHCVRYLHFLIHLLSFAPSLSQYEMAPNAFYCPGNVSLLRILLVVLLLIPLRPTRAGHDYNDALRKCILFFEGQRSGKLPPDQRLKWRRDSALHDGATAGVSTLN